MVVHRRHQLLTNYQLSTINTQISSIDCHLPRLQLCVTYAEVQGTALLLSGAHMRNRSSGCCAAAGRAVAPPRRRCGEVVVGSSCVVRGRLHNARTYDQRQLLLHCHTCTFNSQNHLARRHRSDVHNRTHGTACTPRGTHHPAARQMRHHLAAVASQADPPRAPLVASSEEDA